MGVDTSVGVGVGFKVDRDALASYRALIEDEENYGDEEILEILLKPERELLSFGTGGSYYDNDPVEHVVSVKRVSKSYSTYDIPGGIVGLTKPTITLAERDALDRVARNLGQDEHEVGSYMSVLWH